MDLCVRTDSCKLNTIDPETLPEVIALKKQLAEVTAERDTLIKTRLQIKKKEESKR